MMRRLLICISDANESRLTPRSSKKGNPDRKPERKSGRNSDVRIPCNRGRCRAAPREMIAVNEIGWPRRICGRSNDRVETMLLHYRVDSLPSRLQAILGERVTIL